MSKAQVVYYLSHNGRLEQPHLIEVEHQSSSCLRLRDVKKRLTELRGNDMPDAFSWAYKRSYKNDFIWNDVADDDKITPLVGQDYVLKGSENVYEEISKSGSRRSMKRSEGVRTSVDSFSSLSPFKSHAEQVRESGVYEQIRGSPVASSPRDTTEAAALKVNRTLMESLSKTRSYRAEDAASNKTPSESSSAHVKVYTTPVSPVTADHGRDAATQTEEDHGRSVPDDGGIRFHEQQPGQVECDEVHTLKRRPKLSEESLKSKAASFRHMFSCSLYQPNKPRSDGRAVYSPRSSPGFNKGAYEDPEFMPEVVKETSESQSSFTRSFEVNSPKKECRSKDDRPLTPGLSRIDWEKTFQEAVNAAAPPDDFRLQACQQCGRTFKPESLKVHVRGCRGQAPRVVTSKRIIH